MPYPSTPCKQATPETATRLFQGWPAHRAIGLRLSSCPSDTPRRTPMFPSSPSPGTQYTMWAETGWHKPGPYFKGVQLDIARVRHTLLLYALRVVNPQPT
jgi:hypothetical protein